MKEYYVYIMTNTSGTLYTGVTNDLLRRVLEHKSKLTPGFTKKYNVNKLIYFSTTNDISVAIQFEKKIKGWTRKKKLELIESKNPQWNDLSEGWYEK